jgi:RsiW-degrading membrane proteinase PrsW (M82 family)
MNGAFTLLSGFLPSLLFIWFFYSRDRFPEPPRVIWTTFFLGFAIFPLVLVVETPIDRFAAHLGSNGSPVVAALIQAVFSAAIPEEALKFLVVTRYAAKNRAFDEPMDGIVYGAVASLGFATVENVIYIARNDLSTAIVRALTAVPGHACMGAIMGYYVGQARFDAFSEGERLRKLFTGLGIAILLHSLYDFPLFLMNLRTHGTAGAENVALNLMTIGVLVFEATWTGRLVVRLRRQQDRIPVTVQGGPPSTTAGSIRVVAGAVLTLGAGFVSLGLFFGAVDGGLLPFAVLGGILGVRLFAAGLRGLHPAPSG